MAKKTQKNFALGDAKEPFERWCRQNAYVPKQVFLAGWLALAQMSHEERLPLLEHAGEWIEGGFSQTPLPARPTEP